MSDLECDILVSLYDGTHEEEHDICVDVDEAVTKLVGRGMVERSGSELRLTSDGEHVAVELFACGAKD